MILGISASVTLGVASLLALMSPPRTDAQVVSSATLQGKVCPKGSQQSGCYYGAGNPSPGNAGCDYGAVPVGTFTEPCDKKAGSPCGQDVIACGTYRDCGDPTQTFGTCSRSFMICS